MTVTSDMILTVESIPNYVKQQWTEHIGPQLQQSDIKEEEEEDISKSSSIRNYGADSALRGLEVTTIDGGSVNFSFCLKFPALNNKTLFLKQAPEFVAKFGPDGFPLTSDRIQHEFDVYTEWKNILGATLSKKYLPNIYYFDRTRKVMIMEFLGGHEPLDNVLDPPDNKVSNSTGGGPNCEKAACFGTFLGKVDNVFGGSPKASAATTDHLIASSLGNFLGTVHAATHSSKVSIERQMYLTSHFENREMRNVQLEFVFTKCYKEATAEQLSGLQLTKEFMFEIELLKRQYNGDGCVCGCGCGAGYTLVHGDLHPNSVLVDSTTGSTKVIDPEFTVYGPAGLDIGFLLNGYCLGAIHHAYSNKPNVVNNIIQCAEQMWASYKAALTKGGLSLTIINEIEIETVGFTAAEICRTALGFAGGRSWLQFDDPKDTINSKNAALHLVETCMVARHNIYDNENDDDDDNAMGDSDDSGSSSSGGIHLLFSELKKLTSSLSQPKSNAEWLIWE